MVYAKIRIHPYFYVKESVDVIKKSYLNVKSWAIFKVKNLI